MPSLPDRKGHFGIFGGRYAAETLMPALTGAGGSLSRGRKDKAFREEFHYYLRNTREGRRPVPGAEAHGDPRRGEHLPQARGPEPHRLAQDQQHPRPGPARPADGEEAGDRRDGRGPARRGHRHRGGALRHGVPDLHGRGGHPAAGPQRPSDEDPRRRGRPRRPPGRHPQGRDERGDALLGHRRPGHLLRHRHGGRAPPLPGDGPRFPERHRPGGEAADPEEGGAPPRLPHRLRGRGEQRHGALLPVSGRRQRWR